MSKDLYVKNIAREISEEELRKLFSVCGKVVYIHLVKEAKSGEFLGCAYVKMSSEAEAKDAIVTLDGARMGNREIVVIEALPQGTAGHKGPAGKRPGRSPGGRVPEAKGMPQETRAAGSPEGKGPKRPQTDRARKTAGPGGGFGKGREPGKPGGRGK